MPMKLYGLADCNNFFVSCERVFRPDLRDKPVVVLSNNDGCIIARSNESKALGLQMGDPFFKVRTLLEKHQVAVFSSNYTLYGDMSRRVMSLLSAYTPRLDIYSIDEGFLDLTGRGDAGQVRSYGLQIVRRIGQGTGIPVSLGIAPTRTLAKMASYFAKHYPAYQGVCLIDTREKREKALRLCPVKEVWGIGRHLRTDLEYYGIHTAWDFVQKTEEWIRHKFSISTVRTWKELQGTDCISPEELPHKKSICTSRSFAGEGICDHNLLEEAVANFAADSARKLRQQKTCCTQVTVFAYTSRFRTDAAQDTIQQNITLHVPTQDPAEIISTALTALRAHYKPETYYYKKAGVILWGIQPFHAIQTDLFDPIDRRKQAALTQAIDAINRKNGHNTIRMAVQGTEKQFYLKREHLSRQYTTNLDDIIELHV